jgi:hypothetical protein
MKDKELQQIRKTLAGIKNALIGDDNYAKMEDVEALFTAVADSFKEIRGILSGEMKEGDKKLAESLEKVKEDLSHIETTLKDTITTSSKASMKECMSLMAEKLEGVYEAIEALPKHDEGRIIEDAVSKAQATLLPVIQSVENRSIDLTKPEILKDSLESLKGDERLDKSAIKGLEETLVQSSKGGVTLFGTRGIQLYVDGEKKGLVNMINLIAGTNMTITYTRSYGRNDILLDASGGGGGSFSKLTATGTVNGINTAFTFTSAPSIIIVDGGRAMQKTSSDGTVNWTGTTSITLTLAPNNDIYGF